MRIMHSYRALYNVHNSVEVLVRCPRVHAAGVRNIRGEHWH